MRSRQLIRSVGVPRTRTRNLSTSIPTLAAISRRDNIPTPGPSGSGSRGNANPVAQELVTITARVAKWIILIGLGTATTAIAAFEGLHLYIENSPLAIPSRGDDEYGWEDEVQGWTGGPNGGTDPRLGSLARHALRAAWICQTWGGGNQSGIISRQGLFEPDYASVRGMIGADPEVVFADRGYELATEFVGVAMDAARRKGMVFPPELSVVRPPGPPLDRSTTGATQGDPTVIDLLLLRAGLMERIGTKESLYEAKDIYERVVCAMQSNLSPNQEAKVMRLSNKVGQLCTRLGDDDEALAWWDWGLGRVGLNIPSGTASAPVEQAKSSSSWSWFSKPTKSEKSEPATHQAVPSTLSPAVLRAAISLIVSSETYLAQHSQVAAAHQLETTGLSLLPAPRPVAKPTAATAGLSLHETWLQQRSSLLTLHLAATTYAEGKPALNLANTALTRSDAVIEDITPHPPAYSKALFGPAELIRRDAFLTSAEASYTRGLLLERSGEAPLEVIAECFERAMSLHAQQSGRTEEESMGPVWEKYWKSFARVKGKMGQSIEPVEQI